MRLIKIIKTFQFEEENRNSLTLGSKTRLNPTEFYLELIAVSGAYPLDSDLQVKTWVANPTSVKAWLGFQVSVTHFSAEGVTQTSLGFRLSNGTNEYWWNGAAWEVNTSDWNTEAEIATNIGTFSVTERKIQVVINLKTLDVAMSPLVHSVKVLYEGAIEFTEDLIYRSLIPLLRDQIRPKGRFHYEMPVTASTISLVGITTPYNIVDVDSVFDQDNDPDHLIDLFSSYNPTTKIVALTGAVTTGTVVHVTFLWEPEVAVTTSQDFDEIEKVPAIVLDDINLIESTEMSQNDSVLNLATGAGWKVKAPLRGDLEVVMRMITDKGVDLFRLADEVKRFFMNNQVLRSVGLDEDYRLWLLNEYDGNTTANKGGIHSARLTFRVVDALFYGKEAEEAFGIESFIFSGDMNTTVS